MPDSQVVEKEEPEPFGGVQSFHGYRVGGDCQGHLRCREKQVLLVIKETCWDGWGAGGGWQDWNILGVFIVEEESGR